MADGQPRPQPQAEGAGTRSRAEPRRDEAVFCAAPEVGGPGVDVGPDGTVGGAGLPGRQLHAEGQLSTAGVAALTVGA